MKHFVNRNQHIVITGLLAIFALVVILFVIKAAAQCAPDDLSCISMP
jgi:hypothetical protein